MIQANAINCSKCQEWYPDTCRRCPFCSKKPSAKRAEPLEQATQATVIDTLRKLGILCWPHKNIPVPIRQGSGKGSRIVGLRKADPYLVGLPDVFVVIDGRLICIEMKRKASYWDQQPEQKEWQRRLEKAGARYILAYSLDEVLQGLGIKTNL